MNALLMKVGWQFGVPLGLGLLVLSVMGNEAMALAFGSDYARYGGLVGWQCAQVALTFVWLLFMCKVRTVGRPAHIFLSGSVQAGVSVGAVLLLAPKGAIADVGRPWLWALWWAFCLHAAKAVRPPTGAQQGHA